MVIDIGMLIVKGKIAILILNNTNFEAAFLGLSDETFSGIIGIAIRENCNIHNDYILPRKAGYVNIVVTGEAAYYLLKF